MPQLHVSTGDGQERDVDLGDRPVSFGRADDNDVVLTEQKASRKHCTIRPLSGGWRVVDEQSSNGTWLGGRTVLSARLQSGDEIEIGDTVITFVAQPSEMQKPEIVRPRRPRTIRVPWEAPVVAAVLAAAAWFGAGQFAAEQTARESSLWKRLAAAEIARAPLTGDEAAWRGALERTAQDLGARETAAGAVTMIRGALAGGMPREAPDARKPDWAKSLEQIEAARARMSPTERRTRLRDVLSRHAGDADAVAAVAATLRSDGDAARDRGAAEAARLLGDADQAVAEGAFGRAFDDWAAWLAASPDVAREDERAVAVKMAAARDQAKLAAGVAVALYEEHLKEGRVTAAASAVEAATERLRGTGWDAWLAARTRRYDRGGDGGGAGGTPVAGGPRESDPARAKRTAKDRLDRAMRSSNALAKQCRFVDAAAALNEAAAEVGDAGLQAELKARADDLGSEADVLAKLLEQARADASHFGVVPVAGGTGRVTGANEFTFLIGDPKGANPRPVALDALPPAAFVQILEKAALEPASFVGAALICHEVGELGGYTAWMRKALAVDALRMDASVVHARTLGAALPAAGYVPHPTDGKAICTFDERKAIENAGKIAALTAELARAVEKIDVTKQAKQVQTVQTVYAKLEAARKHALELIFDEVHYFYPYRNRMKEYVPVQKDVDDRVALVREAWEDPVQAKVRTDATLEKLMKHADDLRVEIAFLGGEPSALSDRVERLRMYLGKDLTVQTFFETPADLTLLDTNREMMEANAKVRNGVAEPEREQVRITNEYRRMMGHRRVLRLHDKLVASARGHSDDMSKIGFFDHFSPVEGKKTPMDRMLLAGYPNQPCSENIHMGSGDPQGAHNGWVHSSGHHRNILMPGWSEMGTGQSGRYWTQNFGFASGDEQAGGPGPQ